MKSPTVITSTGRTSTAVSSRVSRTTACSTVSPTSIAPPGTLHRPWYGGSLRRTSRTCEPRNTIAPTAGMGRFGNSYLDIGFGKRKPTPSTLRRLRNVAARVDHRIVVEGPLVQDVLEDLAHPNIAFHRDVEACSEMIQGRLHRREEVWRLSERGTDMLPDVPHADGHDVARMRLPEDDRGSLAPFPLQGFPDCE